MNYKDFLETKKHLLGNFGFEPNFIPDIAFDFQKEIIERAVRKGRMAVFADTGLGKTLIQLAIAKNIVNETKGKVLILTPLAVAFQFIVEAKKIGVEDIEYSRDGTHTKGIVICNYERLHHFNSEEFSGVVLDESSILKNFDGKIKNQITSFVKKVKYRYCSSATPSPNDFTELGTTSEVLGYMGYMDMLGKFFKNNNSSVAKQKRNIGEKYYLKPHAERDFFAWVNQWSIMIKMPSDLGYSDDRYILPPLTVNNTEVENKSTIGLQNQIGMFVKEAKTFQEIRHEQKMTIQERCEKAVELAKGKTSVYWVNLNEESKTIKELDSECVEIIGSMSVDKKEDVLMRFANGEIKRIVTKAKMTGMGLNWQHCNHTVFFPTYSYEQYYQAIRRFWRFGQDSEVVVDMVTSQGQKRVLEAIQQKTDKAIKLYENLVKNVNEVYREDNKKFNKEIQLPTFI